MKDRTECNPGESPGNRPGNQRVPTETGKMERCIWGKGYLIEFLI